MCKPAQKATQIASDVYQIQARPIVGLNFVAFIRMVELSHPSEIFDVVDLVLAILDGLIETLDLELQRNRWNNDWSKWQRRYVI